MNEQNFVLQNNEKNDYNTKKMIEFGVVRFPKEFERQWSDLIDRRFAFILLVSFIFHFMVALYFSIYPPSHDISKIEIEQIQKRYVKIVLDEEIVVEEEKEYKEFIPSEDITVKEKLEGKDEGRKSSGFQRGDTRETKVGTVEGRTAKHDVGLKTRYKTREQISKEVSSKGILGLLSSSGTTATGEEVVDVLGELEQSGTNFDEVLNQIDGIKVVDTRSKGVKGGEGTERDSRNIKGSRTTSGGNIDDMISDRGAAKSTSVSRKGAIVVSEVSAMANEEGRKSESRNPDEVSAIINSHNTAIQYCYQRDLKRNPDLKGKLVIRFTIAANGKVKDVKIISSTLNNERVERCVVSRIRRWDDFGAIDPAKGDVVFRQVYTFGY